MALCVISKSGELRDVCEALVKRDSELCCEVVGENEPTLQNFCTDVFVWDFETAGCPERALVESMAHCVLVIEANNLASRRDQIDDLGVTILLKPINLHALRPFMLLASASRGSNVQLDQHRTERDALLQCLLEANMEIQNFDHMRTNFLARALHDLRAPLTALSGYCGLLLAGDAGTLNARQSEIISRMRHSLARMTRMVSGMFDLSVRQNVQRELHCRRADIQGCIEQVVHETKPLADEKGIEVLVSSQPASPTLAFESSKIEQVLINLLENACKFTPRFGTIQISGYPVLWDTPSEPGARCFEAAATANAYRIDVRDSGPGIADECLETIFEEYTSYDGALDRSGGGLGLAICRMIVAQHQGRIWAEPSLSGACLSFVLPSARSEATVEIPVNGLPRTAASRTASA
jgi:signal transduction histidine kinase